jgi:hypothetical protein
MRSMSSVALMTRTTRGRAALEEGPLPVTYTEAPRGLCDRRAL